MPIASLSAACRVARPKTGSAGRSFSRSAGPARALNAALALLTCGLAVAAEDFAQQRRALLDEIEADVRGASQYLGRDEFDAPVMAAMGRVERHRFVPEDRRDSAYENRPLPIGYGQTISQPYIVAIMTDLLDLKPQDRVFELGTGSGYQAAVLAELVAEVFTMEIIEPLATSARRRLADLGYHNVEVRVGDGYFGWPKQAPFDAIIVTAGADHIPPPLVAQLAPGGRLIMPVGGRFAVQQLVLVQKLADGGIQTRQVMPVMFVPMTGKHD